MTKAPTLLQRIDRAQFTARWLAGATYPELYAEFAINCPAVRRLKAAYGLPHRNPSATREAAAALQARAKEREAEAPAPDAPKVPAMPAHPFWTPARDAVVIRTAGRYAAVAEIAAVLGKSPAAVMQRWHALRAAS